VQVKFFPAAFAVKPTFAQLPPVLTAAFDGIMGSDKKSINIDKNAISLLFIYRE
jgi:hypothetical protein